MREEVIMAGFGGQGIMFMGTVLAQAAMEENKKVTFFPSYGAEMRGGIANCTVIISDEEIGSPVVTNPGTVIALNQQSTNKFSQRLKKGGLLIIDSSLVGEEPAGNQIKKVKIAATRIADELGDKRAANMVALGAYLKEVKILKLESLVKSLAHLLGEKKKGLLDINVKALESGYKQ